MKALILLLAAMGAWAAEPFYLRGGDRVLFLGDSITQAGAYVEYIETFLLTRFPGQRYEIVKLGLSSETVSGLSEADHPFPRPNLHERLDRALAKTRPTVVVACYGMNDGIYAPFAEERFRAYQEGIRKLAAKVRAAGARLVLLTPPPFDARARPTVTAPPYGFKTPYRDYDAVLERYGKWLLTLRAKDVEAIDVHTPMAGRALAPDGIHPNAEGHWIMARTILEAWHAGAVPPFTSGRDTRVLALVKRRWSILGPAWLAAVGHRHPKPPPALPLEEAERQAAPLEAEARRLSAEPQPSGAARPPAR